MRCPISLMIVGAGACLAVCSSASGGPDHPPITQDEAGRIHAGDLIFETANDYVNSDFFREHGLRCGTPDDVPADGGGASDCTLFSTNPASTYDPGAGPLYRIPVVVHVIRASDGVTGNVPESLVHSQIEVLNEDYRALPFSLGQDGFDTRIEFYLATIDPDGNPTTGITYHNNTTWFNDGGAYWNTLRWNPHKYLNIYTNQAGGTLGYVPGLPQSGIVGQASDRVVVYWAAFGDFAPIGPPYNRGRSATHEVGHYLGLYHTFQGGCGSASACYTTGDLICDTGRQSAPTFGCSSSSCGEPDPIDNYLNYTNDVCMKRFTEEQARRLRCSLEHYRSNLYEIVLECPTDLDGSGSTDFSDLLAILAAWGPCDECVADLDDSGSVDFSDLLSILASWGPC